MQKHIAVLKQESNKPLSQIKKTPNPNLPLIESICSVENGKPINRVYVQSKDTGVLSKVGWVIDGDMHQCMLCTQPFTLLTRKHHCRACGLLVCHTCSGNVSLIAGAESLGPQRICNCCHNAAVASATTSVVAVVPSWHDPASSCCPVAGANKLSEIASAVSFDTLSTDNETLDGSLIQDSPKASGSVSGKLLNPLTRTLGVEVFSIAPESSTIPLFIESRIAAGQEKASFLVTNLATVVAQFQQWREELPMVEPFYAVKCNPDPVIVRLLASLGCNFDCATMGEIDLVLNGLGPELSFGRQGRAASSIVYANPAKMEHMLDFAAKNNVRMTVFDGEDELHKIASVEGHERFQLLLRLTTDDKASICRFSKKFGCPVAEAPRLLQVAKSLGLTVAGVSFHVGSGCGDSEAYVTALKHARMVFDEAERIGMEPLSIVDLGGGFPGDTGGYGGEGMPTFQNLASAIRKGVQLFTDPATGVQQEVRFIAEPGRYFVSASTTICTKIYSRKGGNNNYQALYVDDGVYGSFNNVVYDHATPLPVKLSLQVEEDRRRFCQTPTMDVSAADEVESCAAATLHSAKASLDVEPIPTAVFGPTCDGLDQMCSLDSTLLPRCQVGEWLIWPNNGAYTHTASFVFNGYTHIPTKTYCYL